MRDSPEGPRSLVVMAASTGGPRAIEAVLTALPGALDAVVLVALHLPGAFTDAYVGRLDRSTAMAVARARDGARLRAGDAAVLPGGSQGAVARLGGALHLSVRPARDDETYAPSADAIMRSAARAMGPATVGVVLTGMGGDGAAGLASIRAAGGYTIAESRESAVIYGMPSAAVRYGAAMVELPLEEIAAALVARCGLLPPAAAPHTRPAD